ncbi:MAG: Sua5/YciO/YrdC/YwlC family protein [Planctomycetes bacterium]|nr:Sua5/YciO/YrdC/YwlC family protein [Planctomycetota bacterium]
MQKSKGPLNKKIPYLKWHQQEEIISRIKKGEVGITPTETVAGILALPSEEERINAIKESPDTKPLAHIIASAEHCRGLWGDLPPGSTNLASFWPGPLTLIAGPGEGLALRVPKIPELQDIISATGPLVCTSANFSGENPAQVPRDVPNSLLNRIDFIIDEEPEAGLGEASTILKYSGCHWHCLRQGALGENDWKNALDHQSKH